MNIREIRESDIEPVIQLFRANYGDDYAVPEFYDPQWVKRGIYSDHIIWLVIEDDARIVASGAAILDFGDRDDQIAEIGRLVVDPTYGGHGLGGTLLEALVHASNDRVEFAFGEARTTHPKTQKIFDHAGLAPLGFLPMFYKIHYRESWVLSGQLFGNGRLLRRAGEAQVIPEAAPIAELALRNLELDDHVSIAAEARAYPLDEHLVVEPLTGASLVRLLKIRHGRLTNPEVFGGMHVDQGIPQIHANKATYLVAREGENVLGAVGYTFDETHHNVRLIELVGRDDAVKGSLLRHAVEQAEQELEAEMIECDVSAYAPRMQSTLRELGFLPVAYVPGMVFHETARWDIVRMVKLNVAWDLGALEFTDSGRAMFEIVSPAFIQADAHRARKQLALGAKVLEGLSPLEVDFVQRASEELTPAAGTTLNADALYIVLAGSVTRDSQVLTRGECFGASALLGQANETGARAGEGARLLKLTRAGLDALSDKHPRLCLRLYRNLATSAK